MEKEVKEWQWCEVNMRRLPEGREVHSRQRKWDGQESMGKYFIKVYAIIISIVLKSI